jgi:hypothetical protein
MTRELTEFNERGKVVKSLTVALHSSTWHGPLTSDESRHRVPALALWICGGPHAGEREHLDE